jgi:hypothetical protein
MYNSTINPNKQLFPQNYYVIYDNIDFKTLLDYAFKLKISTEEYQGKKVYCIQNDEIKTIIDKENYITLEETYDEITKTYKFETNSVTDEDLVEIDLQEYDVENIL